MTNYGTYKQLHAERIGNAEHSRQLGVALNNRAVIDFILQKIIAEPANVHPRGVLLLLVSGHCTNAAVGVTVRRVGRAPDGGIRFAGFHAVIVVIVIVILPR